MNYVAIIELTASLSLPLRHSKSVAGNAFVAVKSVRQVVRLSTDG